MVPLRRYRYCKRGNNRQWRTRLMEMSGNILGLASFLIKHGQSQVFQRADAWLAFLPADFQYSVLGFNSRKSLCLRSSNAQDSDRNLPRYLSSNRHVAVKYRPNVTITKILNKQNKKEEKKNKFNPIIFQTRLDARLKTYFTSKNPQLRRQIWTAFTPAAANLIA